MIKPPIASEDVDLMARAVDGDQGAFNTLIEKWEMPVKRFLGRMLQNTAEADDLAQEAFVRAWRNRGRFRVGSEFRPWVMGFAAALARERLRWWRRKPAISIEEWTQVIGETDSSTPLSEGEIVLENRSRAVRGAVGDLPAGLREVAVLFEYEGVPLPEIAIILGRSPKAAEVRLYRARAALRASLANVD